MWKMRPAEPGDLNFLVWIDIKDEGVSSTYMANWSDAEWVAHRAQIRAYLDGPDKVALVCEEGENQRVAAVYADFIQLADVADKWAFLSVPGVKESFPAHGTFCCVFQLWVDPRWRRQGVGSQLKQALEQAAIGHGIGAMYTHTEADNQHVIALNQKIGYHEIYRGPMWDAIERVALLKILPGAANAISSDFSC